MFNWSHKEVVPHCTCIRRDSNHKFLDVTKSSDGETCDNCACYVVWKPAGAYLLGDGNKKGSKEDLFKKEQANFFQTEYAIGS